MGKLELVVCKKWAGGGVFGRKYGGVARKVESSQLYVNSRPDSPFSTRLPLCKSSGSSGERHLYLSYDIFGEKSCVSTSSIETIGLYLKLSSKVRIFTLYLKLTSNGGKIRSE